MKKFLFIVVALFSSLYPQWGLFDLDRSWISINFDGSVSAYRMWNGGVANPGFNEANLGTFTSNTQTLAIANWDIKTWRNFGSDVTGVDMKYRVYKQGSTPGSYSSTGGGWIQDINSSDQKWGKLTSTSINISSLESSATYVIEVYIEVYGTNPNETKYDNGTSGSNYKATFTTTSAFPVELTSFNGKVVNGKINLNWNTATEVNNYGFEVERAKAVSGSQNVQFAKVGFVEGNGNSNSPKSYSFTDANVTAGKYIYRLKQIDTDGQFEYSQEIEVSVDNLINGYVLEQNFPNPFNPSTSIKFGFQTDTRAEVKVYNVIGAEVATLFNGMADAGRIYEVTFDASGLASGTYFYKLVTPDKTDVRKMILMK
ncbi:MAG: T9SS type A sorting domain-containing protein [Ignavibacteriales bacterium]|nr:MAG: T9SS type A sorting domain-containing protein [Ignavibacteriales bacterium]